MTRAGWVRIIPFALFMGFIGIAQGIGWLIDRFSLVRRGLGGAGDGRTVRAHAVTNLALGIYVLQTRAWRFW